MRNSRVLIAGLVVLVALLTGCGAAGGDAPRGAEPRVHGQRGEAAPQRLDRNGISLRIPVGWDGRVLFRESSGRDGVIFQVANFELPANDGLAPPAELPPGEEDPLKAMTGRDVLVMISDGAGEGSPAPRLVTVEHLAPIAGPRVPRGHSLAARSFCFGRRCVDVEVDFGSTSPGDVDVRRVDEVLASLSVAS
jgi:hypothetical protein